MEIISYLFEVNPYVYGVNLAGNVGHQHAIMAGMMTAKDMCDAVITIDADLQDDLKAIEEWWIVTMRDMILYMV